MQIDLLWPTPVAVTQGALSPNATQALIALIHEKDKTKDVVNRGADQFKAYVEQGRFYRSIHYNLFDYSDQSPFAAALLEFEAYACAQMRHYLRDAMAAEDADTVLLSARCFGHVHRAGQGTFPHYHQASDIVLVHYLSVGDGRSQPLSLVMQDPRGAPNYPWWDKMHVINPVSGTTVIHPSFLWHSATEWAGNEARELIAVNFKIVGHGHEPMFRPTRF